MKLLFRGEKLFDERFDDYVARLAALNGYCDEKVFSKSLYSYFRSVYGNVLFGCSDDRKRFALEHILKRSISTENEAYRYPLWKSITWKSRSELRVCYRCLEIKKYVRFYWREHWYAFCHLHECELIACRDIWKLNAEVRAKEIGDDDKVEIECGFVEVAIAYRKFGQNFIDDVWKEHALIECDCRSVVRLAGIIEEDLGVKLNSDITVRKIKSGILFQKGFGDRVRIIVRELTRNNAHLQPLLHFLFVTCRIINNKLSHGGNAYWFEEAYSGWAKREVFSSDELLSLWQRIKSERINQDLPSLNFWGANMIRQSCLLESYRKIKKIDDPFAEMLELWVLLDDAQSL
ncbi:MAG: hypothetical protein HPY82_16940 [Gammaproteobacteria bacterium]|nr:hypothetical protein [Gammaproteobacteria bacterium]